MLLPSHKFLPPLFSPDPRLTAENVSSVLQTVDWGTVYRVLSVPRSRRHLIEKEYSTEPRRRQAAVDWWLRYSPTASWTWLAGQLYRCEERTALKAVMQYIAKETAGAIISFTPVLRFTVHMPSKSLCTASAIISYCNTCKFQLTCITECQIQFISGPAFH